MAHRSLEQYAECYASQSSVLPYFASEEVEIIPVASALVVRSCVVARDHARCDRKSLGYSPFPVADFYEHCSVVYFAGSPT